jgi:predicted nucleic acid-binding Zn ribbon protein
MYKPYESIDKVISRSAKEKKMLGAVNRYKTLKNWEKAAGGFILQAGELTRALDLKNGVLFIACLSREIAYQIKLLASRIITVLNQLVGKQVVFAIQIEV